MPYSPAPAPVAPAPKKRRSRRNLYIGIAIAVIVVAIIAANTGHDSSNTPASVTPTVHSATSQPTAIPTWRDGALTIFHSTDTLNPGSYTDAFTVPGIWRIKWFCTPSSDPTQAFFGFSVQHAGDLVDADGSTPLQVDCDQQQNGFLVEHVGGNVTMQILGGTGTSWDVYIQIPQ